MKEYSRQAEKDVLSGILNHPEQLIRHKKILNREFTSLSTGIKKTINSMNNK